MESKRMATDFELLLLLKNQLIVLSDEGFKDMYDEVENYIVFLNTVLFMLNVDDNFLYLSRDFVGKIEKVLQFHRFDLDNKDITNRINEITLRLNDIYNTSRETRYSRIIDYITYNEKIRHDKYKRIADLGNVLANDAIVYFTLMGDIKEKIGDVCTLSSINYFLSTVPEIFDDIEVAKRAKLLLTEISHRGKIFNISDIVKRKEAKLLLKEIK